MTTLELAKVTSKGQITLPVSIREMLGAKQGDKIVFVRNRDGDITIKTADAAMAALYEVQKSLEGVAEKSGLKDEQDIIELIKEVRAERAAKNARHARH